MMKILNQKMLATQGLRAKAAAGEELLTTKDAKKSR
jgi:hypothetical protein